MSDKVTGNFVGLQVTRLNFLNFQGQQKMNKTSSQLRNMVVTLGFIFIIGIYSQEIFCGCYLLTPDDWEFIETLSFEKFGTSVFKNNKDPKGSLTARFAPYLFLWQKTADPSSVNESIKQNFVTKIENFLKRATMKYSIE